MRLALKFLLISSIQLLVFSNLVFANTRDGLVGWWNLDDGSGTSAIDSSSQGNVGTLVNTPTWATNCKHNGCILFNGSTQTVTIAANPVTTTPISFSAWVISRTGGAGVIVSVLGGTNYNGFFIEHTSSNYAAVTADVGTFARSTKAAGTLGAWHHVAGVITDNVTRTVYVDGVAGTTDTTSKTPTTTPDKTTIAAGRLSSGVASNQFDGSIDDVRIYNRAITAQEVVDLYSAGAIIRGNGNKLNY